MTIIKNHFILIRVRFIYRCVLLCTVPQGLSGSSLLPVVRILPLLSSVFCLYIYVYRGNISFLRVFGRLQIIRCKDSCLAFLIVPTD